MATTAEYGFGPYQFPRGWFMIAGSEEASTTPKAVRFFGTDMVLYRGQSGKVHLIEAYCPHMGAHIARSPKSSIVRDGEQVTGDSIRCPFHGWRFNAEGQCDHIPYSDSIPKAACLRKWKVEEKAGTIWLWHDPEGLEPQYPLSDFGNYYGKAGWIDWQAIHLGDLDIHGCEIVDNMADYGHMAPIHGTQDCVYFSNEFKEHIVHQYFGTHHRTAFGSADGMLMLDTWRTGPGMLESAMEGVLPAFLLVANTPIDDGRERVWFAVMVQANDGTRPATAEELAAAREYHDGLLFGLDQDVEIWSNKQACVNPLALPADGPYGRLRTWYRQFYNPRDKAAQFHQRTNGTTVTLDRRAELRIPA